MWALIRERKSMRIFSCREQAREEIGWKIAQSKMEIIRDHDGGKLIKNSHTQGQRIKEAQQGGEREISLFPTNWIEWFQLSIVHLRIHWLSCLFVPFSCLSNYPSPVFDWLTFLPTNASGWVCVSVHCAELLCWRLMLVCILQHRRRRRNYVCTGNPWICTLNIWIMFVCLRTRTGTWERERERERQARDTYHIIQCHRIINFSPKKEVNVTQSFDDKCNEWAKSGSSIARIEIVVFPFNHKKVLTLLLHRFRCLHHYRCRRGWCDFRLTGLLCSSSFYQKKKR